MSYPAALYYPHTNITDKSIIKNSLLLWDQVEYITPSKHWVHRPFESKAYNQAIEIISKPHYPTNTEREEVHSRVSTLIQKGLPPWLFLDAGKNVRNFTTYPIYPDKLAPKTWDLLRQHNLVRFNERNADFDASAYFGLMIMSLLADACAGETKRKITDQGEAYSWLHKYSTAEAGGEYIIGPAAGKITNAITRLVSISIKVLNTDDIPITTLVAMRKREAKSSTNDYRNFRMSYLNKLEQYVNQITKFSSNKHRDVEEMERQFKISVENDLKEIKRELNINTRKTLLSKEVLTTVLAAGSSVALPLFGLGALATTSGVVGVGALAKLKGDYSDARRKIMKGNSMSWLYLADKKANRFNPRKVIF